LKFEDRFAQKYSNFIIHKNPSIGSRVVPCGQTERWTTRQTDIAEFRNFSKPPKIIRNRGKRKETALLI